MDPKITHYKSKPGKASPLMVCLRKKGQRALISLSISVAPEQWDSENEIIVNHSRATSLNVQIKKAMGKIQNVLSDLELSEEISSLNVSQIKERIEMVLSPKKTGVFAQFFRQFIENKEGRTKEIYQATLNRINAFQKNPERIKFEDITIRWLEDFDAFLSKTSPSKNARNIHFRNIRAVFNKAIDEELTSHYPFRRFKLRPEPTRKRNFSSETIKSIIKAENLEDWQVKYRDFFALTFMFIGINVVDLCRLQNIRDGRVEYIRAKTHKPYSIKVEPEALELIEKYRGKKHLLNYLDTYKNYRSFYSNLCVGLRGIRDALGLKELTTYWARHSWATIAASLDIPKETIAAALGHGGNTVTDIYIDFDQRKVDEANRRVLDWVLYGKK